jgi:hypothetical protein
MKRCVVLPLSAIAACGLSWVALAAPSDPPAPPSPMERMQRWTQNHDALLTARLAGLKAGLKLTVDQEKLWGPFEASVRGAAQMRADRMKARMERRNDDAEDAEPMSPIDRLSQTAERLSQSGDALKKVADAAKPLYTSFDDTQKRVFGFLSREMMMMGSPHRGMGPREAWMGPHPGGPRGPDDRMHGSDGQGPHGDRGPPDHHPDDQDGPDEE